MKSISFLILFLLPVILSAQGDHLVSFQMEDQFRKVHTQENFLGKVIVMIGSDGGGSKYNKKWADAIDDELIKEEIKNRINWLPVADVSAAPFFLKGYIRNQFPEDEKEWVLCDWNGTFAEAYEFEDGKSNIIIFNTFGQVLHKCSGKEVDEEILTKILSVIKNNS